MKKILAFLISFSLITALIPCMRATVYAGTKTYDLKFTNERTDKSVTLSDVEIGTDEACISYAELASMACNGDHQYTEDNISHVGSDKEYPFQFDGNNKRVKVVRAFEGTEDFNVRFEFEDLLDVVTVTCKEHKNSGKPDKKHKSHKKGKAAEEEEDVRPAVVNPDTVEGFFAVNGQILPGVLMGKMKQGPAAQVLLSAGRPIGWTEAFTFNLSIGGKTDHTLKNGKLCIFVPVGLRKAGRSYAVIGIDKNANVLMFNDTDAVPDTLTADINFEGYAFSFIYRD